MGAITIDDAIGIRILSHDPDEDRALAAIGAAINAETQDIAADSQSEADVSQLENANAATSSAPVMLEPAPAEGEPKPAESEVDSLMAKYDNEEKHDAYLKSDAYK